MAYRRPNAAPASVVEPARRGRPLGRFCHSCGGTFPPHLSVHRGKGVGLSTRDHVASPCTHEGDRFEEGEEWWEPAVEVLPASAGEYVDPAA